MRSVILFLLIILSAFIVSFPASSSQTRITFWTTEMETERVEIQRKIARTFTAKTGIYVHVIPVRENRLAKKFTVANAAKALPDVLYHPIDFTPGWADEGLLDVQCATDIINRLGKKTFDTGALNLSRFSGGYAAVPIDGWRQLLLYRKDIFKEKGLPVPDSWNSILQAAKALHNPPLIWGFVAATDPGQIYTQQIFEHFALSNGVRLIDSSGKVDLNTPEMIRTLEFYKALTRFTPRGNIDLIDTRRDYISGRAAMIMWSPFILDELSGLYKDLPVIPDIIKGKPGYLAENTGFISTILGPKGSAQYSQINCLGITRDANKAPAKKWMEFLLSDGYLEWLDMAPEGKLPMRKGTRHEPDSFIKGWMSLEFGVTVQAKISEFYGMDVIKTITDSADNGLSRWGFTENKRTLVSRIYETKVIPKILKRFLCGELSAKQAALMMDEQVKALELQVPKNE